MNATNDPVALQKSIDVTSAQIAKNDADFSYVEAQYISKKYLLQKQLATQSAQLEALQPSA